MAKRARDLRTSSGRARSTIGAGVPVDDRGSRSDPFSSGLTGTLGPSDERARDECVACQHARRNAARLLEPPPLHHPLVLSSLSSLSSLASSSFLIMSSCPPWRAGPCARVAARE